MFGWRWQVHGGWLGDVGRGAAVLVTFALILTGLPVSEPAGAATLTAGGFTSFATVSSTSAAPGDTVSIVVHLTSTLAIVARVEVAIDGPAASVLNPVAFDNQSFTPGAEQTFPVTWVVPGGAAAGGYSVDVRVYGPAGAQARHVNDSAAFFTVGMTTPLPPGPPIRIMPLGDSLTDGYTVEGGYRIDLWTQLGAAHHSVDFVGSRYNGPPGLADKDHEGHSGWRIDEIASGVGPWLQAYQPRVVLVLIGTNDMIQDNDVLGAPARLSALLDQIRSAVPGVAIIVSSLPRVAEAGALQRIQTFNAAIPGIVTAKGSGVTFVDAFTAIQPSHLDPDGVHLTTDGYSRLAQVWYPALHTVLNDLPTPTPTPTLTPIPTPTATATPSPCSPRPPVLVSTVRASAGRLSLTISATGAGNALREVRVGAARNATIDLDGRSGTADFSVTLSGSPTSIGGAVTRVRVGEAVQVPLIVVDQCGEWRTFVGGGPTGF